jgi:hypothetical protein
VTLGTCDPQRGILPIGLGRPTSHNPGSTGRVCRSPVSETSMAKKVKTGCRDCRKCTNSKAANFGRNTGRGFMAYATVGMSELALATRKSCRICGHQLSLHEGSEATTVQPVFEMRTQFEPGPRTTGPAPMSNVTEELTRLASLHTAGQLTDDEFATLKASVIAGDTSTAPMREPACACGYSHGIARRIPSKVCPVHRGT